MKLSELKTRDDIGLVLNEMGLTNEGVEVGVAFGENAELILDKSLLEKLYLVDPWRKIEGQNVKGYADAIKDWEGCYNYCREKLKRFGDRKKYLTLTSTQAASMFNNYSLDFVYIDANHMSPYIDQDLEAWWPKVKIGGIFGGHDYHNIITSDYQCDVKNAVDAFIRKHNLTIHVTEDKDPSFYIVK